MAGLTAISTGALKELKTAIPCRIMPIHQPQLDSLAMIFVSTILASIHPSLFGSQKFHKEL